MTRENHNALWRDFPKTAQEFDARFATEADCRAYWIEARWGGQPACARCASTRVWTERDGFLFECAECGHQTSLTSGTLLEKTRKPFKTWFRAVFEISTRRTGISGKDLQRILGFGSDKTAWLWLHKLRAAMGPGLPLDDLAAEALAARHACRRRARQASAGLSRRVRFPPQPPQDQRRRADRGARDRKPRRQAADDHAKPYRPHPPLPLVRITSSCRRLN